MSNQERDTRRRNNKVQPLQRGYGCPCGKTYLSYPALFTHIKQKHDGKMDDNPLQHIQQAIQSEQTAPYTTLRLTKAPPGKQTVNQVLNLFFKQAIQYVTQPFKLLLSGYLQVIRLSVDNQNGEGYCQLEDASEIIESANEIVKECERREKSSFRMSRDGVIKLTKLFFEWMYKSDLTDHVIEDQKNVRLEM